MQAITASATNGLAKTIIDIISGSQVLHSLTQGSISAEDATYLINQVDLIIEIENNTETDSQKVNKINQITAGIKKKLGELSKGNSASLSRSESSSSSGAMSRSTSSSILSSDQTNTTPIPPVLQRLRTEIRKYKAPGFARPQNDNLQILEGIKSILNTEIVIGHLRTFIGDGNAALNLTTAYNEIVSEGNLKNIQEILENIKISTQSLDLSTQITGIGATLQTGVTSTLEKASSNLSEQILKISDKLQEEIKSLNDVLRNKTQELHKDLNKRADEVLQRVDNVQEHTTRATTSATGNDLEIENLIITLENFYKENNLENLEQFKKVIEEFNKGLNLLPLRAKHEQYILEQCILEYRRSHSDESTEEINQDTAFNEIFRGQVVRIQNSLISLYDTSQVDINTQVVKCLELIYTLKSKFYDRTSHTLQDIKTTIQSLGPLVKTLSDIEKKVTPIIDHFSETGKHTSNITQRISMFFNKKIFFTGFITSGVIIAIIGSAIFPEVGDSHVNIKKLTSALLLFCGIGLLLSSFSQIDRKSFYKTNEDQYGKSHAIFFGAVPALILLGTATFIILRAFEIQPQNLVPGINNETILTAAACASIIISCIVFAIIDLFQQKNPNSNLNGPNIDVINPNSEIAA